MKFKLKIEYIFFISLIIFTLAICYFSFVKADSKNQYLKVAFLDVGQGDSIFIEAPNGKQILIDGGPDNKVLSKLGDVMPLGDRSIDMIIATHADSDHVGGLPAVLDLYQVSMILENGATSKTKIYQALEDEITTKKIKKEIAKRGMKIMLDDEKNIYLEILFPDRDISSLDSNDGSIVGKLVYGNESFMLTGDATNYTENIITWNETPETLHSNILKLGHHGSRTSNSYLWLQKVNPEEAIISAGLNNRYGHPHQETLDRLAQLNIPYLNTAKEGTIIFQTDGIKIFN